MKYDQFLAAVRERGSYPDRAEAERVTRTVLSQLGQRLAGGEPKDLAAQLPPELQEPLLQGVERDAAEQGAAIGEQEFIGRVAQALGGASEETARWDASAVLTTVAEAVSGGELNQILTQLPPAYAPLFGKPELA